MTTNNSISESNTSLFIKDNNRKTISGFFPLLKYKENLYNSCQSKFSKFLNKSHDIKLLINNRINEKISINDYIINSYNNLNENKLTPIPFINKRKLKNNLEKKELKNFQRNVVFMRRLEYTNKMYENKIKKKYKNYTSKIIILQKVIRGYLVRKVIFQINIIKETLANFFYSIHFCIIKKFYYIFNQKIANYNNKTEKNNYLNNKVENGNNHKENNIIKNEKDLIDVEFNEIIKNQQKNEIENNINMEIYNSNKYLLEKSNKNNNNNNSSKKNKEKHESIIENDDYIEFSSKQSKKNYKILEKNINSINKNSRNDLLNYKLSSISSLDKLKRTKTETIQRQFRKYLSKKGYYGKFDKRKIAIIYLIKYMIVNNVRPYILSILKLFYKEIKEIQSTQEENYYNVSTERINLLNKNYLSAINEIN